MDELIAFITARLDEDERIARAVTPDDWGDGGEWARHEWEDLPDAAFTHAKHHDPARVLREVEAGRAILGLAAKTREWTEGSAGATAGYASAVVSDTLHALATAWSDHADYRQEWAS